MLGSFSSYLFSSYSVFLMSIAISSLSPLILIICVIFLFFISLAKLFPLQWSFKRLTFGFIDFLYWLSVFNFTDFLLFIISTSLFNLGFICSSSSSFFRSKLTGLILEFCSFLWCSTVFCLMNFRQVQQIFICFLTCNVYFVSGCFLNFLFLFGFQQVDYIVLLSEIYLCLSWLEIINFIYLKFYCMCQIWKKKYLLYFFKYFFYLLRGLSYPYMREIYIFHISLRLCWFKDLFGYLYSFLHLLQFR